MFTFNIDQPGIYTGQCSQLCGLYHSLMYFQIKAVSPAAYQSWLSANALSPAQAAAAAAATASQASSGIPVKPAQTNYGVK